MNLHLSNSKRFTVRSDNCKRIASMAIMLLMLVFGSQAEAAGCQPQSITVASGGTVVTDLSNCTVSGINGYQSPPQHGVNDSRNNNGTGLVYYTNNGDGSTTDSFSVIDADDNSVIPFSVTVQQTGPSVTTTNLPDPTIGTAYNQSLAASGGSTPYTWSRTGGSLPSGLSLSSAGVVSGTPTQAGAFSPVFTVTDNANRTASRTVTLNVSAPTLAISPATLPNAVAGVAYTQTLGTSGGTAPYTYLVSGGTPPPGITVSSTGNVSGNATTPGNYSFTVRSTDSSTGSGAPFNTTRNYSVTVSPPTITVAPATLPNPRVGVAYSQTVSASGGTAPYTFAITAGALPAGMNLGVGGTLSGTSTSAGTFNFTVTATDNGGFTGSRSYTITVAAPTITIAPTSLPNAVAGQAYSTTVSASGGTAAYSYAITSGSLPNGISMTPTGVISGTSTVAGNFTFTVTATDSSSGAGAPFTGARTYTLGVAAPTVVVAPTTLPNFTVGAGYSQNVSASGGTAPYTFAITAGVTPAGITLSVAGVLSGTPTSAGTFNFTATATDSNGFTGNRAYTVTVAAPTITVAPTSLPNAVAGQAYSSTLTANGGTAPYSFAITAGALPSGVSLSPTGVLAGTATVAGTFNFTVSATDGSSGSGAPFSGSRAYALTVGAPAVTIAPLTLPSPTGGTPYSQNLSASGGSAPYSFSISAGSLPAGLTLSTAGVLSGTPAASGTFNFTATATDANGFTGGRAYTFSISAPVLTITPSTLSAGTVGLTYRQTISTAGGTAPYSYAISAGTLPPGLSLASATGALTGAPTTAGSFNFTIAVTDALGFSDTRAFSIAVAVPAAIPTLSEAMIALLMLLVGAVAWAHKRKFGS
ncbi:IPTL-CTERM sorting domain-containing protein [Xylophilus sp. Leaf220]|uniref:IPTL-CTERM sorting domain-containing protein n=1 Tax=Xylophilus sp. Leaf220 TaxID=1735686 RepID=UPI0014444180|nr:IPTL-CTERM sorting domain-containing protein [Xylophilus sp. Leaf220]